MAEPQARGASWPLAVRSSYAEANFLARVRAITRAHSTATLHFLLSPVYYICSRKEEWESFGKNAKIH